MWSLGGRRDSLASCDLEPFMSGGSNTTNRKGQGHRQTRSHPSGQNVSVCTHVQKCGD